MLKTRLPLARQISACLLALTIALASTASALAQQSPSDTPSSGTYVADLGLRPGSDGFSFENYGNDIPVTNLTADDLRRLFGDEVCDRLTNGKCVLAPAAKEWMTSVNKDMAGGHCEGLATLSLLMYLGKVQPSAFGASTTAGLQLAGNQSLQREIAYWFATQFTVPAGPSENRSLSPSGVVDALVQALQPGRNSTESYTLGIFERNGEGGHAIVPYAIEDRGDGIDWIMVYDNNFPDAVRHVEVDRNRETWRYYGSTNPAETEALYEGDAGTHSLTLTPTSPRLVKQGCPFCVDDENDATGGAARYDELSLDGDGHVLITDQQGRRFGFVNNQLVTEIPGVSYAMPKDGATWSLDGDPVYFLPAGQSFSITVDGSGLMEDGSADLTLVGPGYDLAVNDISLRPGQKDSLQLTPGRSTSSVAYTTQSDESPDIVLGMETKAADYSFDVQGVRLRGGGTISVTLDQPKGQLAIATSGGTGVGTYSLEMDRTDDDDEVTFSHDRVPLSSGDTAYLRFGQWRSDADSIPLAIDRGSKGSIDEVLDLTDDE
ncbi:MAG: hypothetical protein JO020_25250 [Chloroflexi bacterium]|nr:hypothetical protein [Chloroflexota bacterium]